MMYVQSNIYDSLADRHGSKWKLIASNGSAHGSIVKLPGTVYRWYGPVGQQGDCSTLREAMDTLKLVVRVYIATARSRRSVRAAA